VQGLDKAKLLSTAAEYLHVLETDATRFQATATATLEEKVNKKRTEAEEKSQRIQSLSREISDLQQQIIALQTTIKENEEKIRTSTGGYAAESESRKARIQADIEKINRFIH
jgi:predicted  nucleic acid-binding Zn-ribbon protein